jgi:hypothetical protein
MKVLAIVLTLVGIGATAPLNAQVIARNPTNDRVVSTSGSWRVWGRDSYGNTVYERTTRDRNGNIVIQRARRDRYGNMSVYSTRTVRDDRYRRDCDYNRSTNSVGDIIFGRSNDRVCDDEYSREDGGWYQVGRGRDNNSIYERRTRDRNGNLIIQRARRNSNGRLTIFSTRMANSNDRQWKKDRKDDRRDDRWDRKNDRRDDHRDRNGRDRDSDDDRGRGRGRGNN